VPGETTKPESIRPGSRTFCSTCASAVSQEVLAPFGVARSLSFLNRVDTAGRARGLSGAPVGARGRRPSSKDLHRLDPDGWLVQSSIDTNSTESPAAQRRTRGANEKSIAPQPRGFRSSFLISLCLLDRCLLMGGTATATATTAALLLPCSAGVPPAMARSRLDEPHRTPTNGASACKELRP